VEGGAKVVSHPGYKWYVKAQADKFTICYLSPCEGWLSFLYQGF